METPAGKAPNLNPLPAAATLLAAQPAAAAPTGSRAADYAYRIAAMAAGIIFLATVA